MYHSLHIITPALLTVSMQHMHAMLYTWYKLDIESFRLGAACSPHWLGIFRYDLSSFQSGAVVSSSLLGALAGSAAAFVVGDKLGRKRELILAAILYGD